jgi:hypothetical protein
MKSGTFQFAGALPGADVPPSKGTEQSEKMEGNSE